jgi:hypothetical protein
MDHPDDLTTADDVTHWLARVWVATLGVAVLLLLILWRVW